MTKEQEKISEKNKYKAWGYFVSIGAIPKDAKKYSYVLHHIDPSWKHNDIERYIQWNPEDLVIMTRAEHVKLHWEYDREIRIQHISEGNKGKKCGIPRDLETRKKISESLTGRHISEEAKKKVSEFRKGKKHSEETKKKTSESMKQAWAKRRMNAACTENK